MSKPQDNSTCDVHNNSAQYINSYPNLDSLREQGTNSNNQRYYQPSESASYQLNYAAQPIYPEYSVQQNYQINAQPIYQPTGVNVVNGIPVSGQPVYAYTASPQPSICGMKAPLLDQTTAIIVLILNMVVLPGLGTMIVGCIGPGQKNCCAWFWIGMAQFFTCFCLVGWIWSIVTSVQLIQYSSSIRLLNGFNQAARPVQ